MRDIARYVFSSLIPFLYPNFLSLFPKVWTVMVPDPTDHRSLKKLLIPIPCLVITDSGLWSQIHPSNPWSHPFDPLSLSEKKKDITLSFLQRNLHVAPSSLGIRFFVLPPLLFLILLTSRAQSILNKLSILTVALPIDTCTGIYRA